MVSQFGGVLHLVGRLLELKVPSDVLLLLLHHKKK